MHINTGAYGHLHVGVAQKRVSRSSPENLVERVGHEVLFLIAAQAEKLCLQVLAEQVGHDPAFLLLQLLIVENLGKKQGREGSPFPSCQNRPLSQLPKRSRPPAAHGCPGRP